MNIKNCSNCGKIYSYDGFNTCKQCRKDQEEAFQRVKDYIYKHPGADISEVSEATEVESKEIIEFLKQGRLEIKDENNMILDCERCGIGIRTGRFCNKCIAEMENEFKDSIGGKKESPVKADGEFKQRIRVGDRRKKRKK